MIVPGPDTAAALDEEHSCRENQIHAGVMEAADWVFMRRVVMTICLVGLTYLLWSVSRVLLLVFAAILVAVLLNGLAKLVADRTPVPKRWSLALVTTFIATLVVALFTLFGAQIADQLHQVVEQLPSAANSAGERLGITNVTGRVEEVVADGDSTNVMSRVAGLGFTALGVVGDLIVVLVAGLYLASAPGLYRRGAIKLFPPAQHDSIYEAFDAVAAALRLWSGGQLVAMLLVGVSTGAAFWLIGLPLPIALGVIAGLTNFIPFLGPILGSIPAVIFASTIGPTALIWTVVAVVVIQQIEGNVITPLIQKHAVSLPPALALFAIVVFGLLFGFLGVLLAVPMAVALMVLVKKLWVREVLGEETSLPGEEMDGRNPAASEPR